MCWTYNGQTGLISTSFSLPFFHQHDTNNERKKLQAKTQTREKFSVGDIYGYITVINMNIENMNFLAKNKKPWPHFAFGAEDEMTAKK